jgi:UDP-2-acetamido-3-amino-2,3-dideoxy-glucuronate N-acetyltransferase
MDSYFKHQTALVESPHIGQGTRIWAFVHIMKSAVIGKNCNIGDLCFIEAGVKIGDNVTIKNNTAIWKGVTIEQNVFIGPNVVFTNDLRPRSPRLSLVAERYHEKKTWLRETIIQEGASIGANATILCGLKIAEYAMIGAGTLVTRNVPAYSLFYGIPGRHKGYVCRCGEQLLFQEQNATCLCCGCQYRQNEQRVTCTHVPEKYEKP